MAYIWFMISFPSERKGTQAYLELTEFGNAMYK